MPIVSKSNMEMTKIHPLMILHITPPKNLSITTLKKDAQNAVVSKAEDGQKKKITKKSSEESDDTEEQKTDQEEATNESGKKITKDGKKRKSKKVVIRRVKRRLSLDTEEKPETEVEEKEIEPKTPDTETEEPEIIPGKKSCLKIRCYEPGETVMYADRIKKTIKWKKAIVLEKITSISYKLDVEGEEKPAHISYIKKYTDKKVHFGGKEYLEIDYALDEDDDDDEEEERYNIWARV